MSAAVMHASVMRLDTEAYRRRSRVTMGVSLAVHTLLMLCLVLSPKVVHQLPALTEITLVEPGDLGGAPAGAPAASASDAIPGVAVQHPQDESFKRTMAREEMTPEPQSAEAVADRITARLAAAQDRAPAPIQGTSTSALTKVWNTPAAPSGAIGGGGTALSLTRGAGEGTSTGPALALTRAGSGVGPATVSTGLPAEREASAPARGGESVARKVAAGAMLAGPIADRPILSYVKPVYPEWAKRDAVEGSVTLYFIVRPDGTVRENVLVQKTAGFEDFDESARTALKAWRFAPLREGRTGEQWGTITFHFRLQEAG